MRKSCWREQRFTSHSKKTRFTHYTHLHMVDVVGVFVFFFVYVSFYQNQTHWIFYWINIYTGYFLLCQHNSLFFYHRIQCLKLEPANTWFPSHISVNRMEKFGSCEENTHIHGIVWVNEHACWPKKKEKKLSVNVQKRGALTKKSIDHKIWAGYFFFHFMLLPSFFVLCSEFWVSTKIAYRIYGNHGKGYMKNKRHVY